jgi:hypothetical protein
MVYPLNGNGLQSSCRCKERLELDGYGMRTRSEMRRSSECIRRQCKKRGGDRPAAHHLVSLFSTGDGVFTKGAERRLKARLGTRECVRRPIASGSGLLLLVVAHDGHGQVWGVVCRKCSVPEMFQQRMSSVRRCCRLIYSSAARPAAWGAIVSVPIVDGVGGGERRVGRNNWIRRREEGATGVTIRSTGVVQPERGSKT